MFRENGVVFLGKVRWISFRLGGDGGTTCEFNMCFVRGVCWGVCTLWQTPYFLAKGILRGKIDVIVERIMVV